MNALPHATNIVRKLTNAGYIAYFAGGWVRDYVMDHPSSDIDIATNAPPEVILDLFPRTLLVGLAFGVIIVLSNGHQFEVSTFRRDLEYKDGRKPEKIELATPEEDAMRRDFTINGMFYDPLEEKIYDYVGGMEDIERGVIRAIGDPYERFTEDRLRMIRAIRFSARFDFLIDQDTQDAISENAEFLFPSVAVERIWQEFGKMTDYPRFEHACIEMQRLGLLPVIFPDLRFVHLNDFKQRVRPFSHYLSKTPTVLYLLDLFPQHTVDQLTDLCRGLKMSGTEIKLLEFAYRLRQTIKTQNVDPLEWTYLYAHPEVATALHAYAAQLVEEEKGRFLGEHEVRMETLKPHIERVQNKKPLLTASHLLEKGIPPGKAMGNLLKEAEALTIIHNLESYEDVLARLIDSTHWPKL